MNIRFSTASRWQRETEFPRLLHRQTEFGDEESYFMIHKTQCLLWTILIVMTLHSVSFGVDVVDYSLLKIVNKLAKENPKLVIGYEQVPQLNNHLGDLNIKASDIDAIGKAIAANTDYELVRRPGLILICPKDNPSNNDIPLSKRIVTVPSVKKLPPRDFIKKLSGKALDVTLWLSANKYCDTTKPITFEGSNSTDLANVLTELASRLGANQWEIDRHGIIIDEVPVAKPFKLGSGIIKFYRDRSIDAIDGVE